MDNTSIRSDYSVISLRKTLRSRTSLWNGALNVFLQVTNKQLVTIKLVSTFWAFDHDFFSISVLYCMSTCHLHGNENQYGF